MKQMQKIWIAVLGLMLIQSATVHAADFVHPGGLHTQADFDRMRAKVEAKAHPWIDGWNTLIADRKAQNTWKSAPKANLGVSRQRAQDDALAAYLNALRWRISGDTSYADCAARNLNSWTTVVNQVPSGQDQPGLGGIPIGTFAIAAEVLRDYPGWPAADQAKFKRMLVTYFYPAVNDFLTRHNNAHPTTYWTNWDAANVVSLLAIGVYCDDHAKFEQGIEYYKNGIGMGSILHAVPYLYPGNLGQWQESGRDHAHAFGGLGLLVEACQVAWNQGIDLFGYADDRILAGANYEARYAQWMGVPYTFYTNAQNANQYWISANYHGRLSNCEFYELLYNHYAIRRGRAVPDVKRFAELLRPEGGNVDLCGYGTLTYTLDAAASPVLPSDKPPAPQDLVANVSAGRVFLMWSPSGAYTTRGYAVWRALQPDGAFTKVFSNPANASPIYTDTDVENGKTYAYAVEALNQVGASARSAAAQATPKALGTLPPEWSVIDWASDGGQSGFADVGDGTFSLASRGGGIGGTSDAGHFIGRDVSGDITLTARLIEKSDEVEKVGLMVRQSEAADAPAVALTLGQVGGRQARFTVRPTEAAQSKSFNGNDYTWLPTWFRIQRQGDTFVASQSSDGVTWFAIGKADVPMGTSCRVGLAISSAKPKAPKPAAAMFDHLSIAVRPPDAPATPRDLRAQSSADGIVLTWTTGQAVPDGFRIERSEDGKLFYEIASLPADAKRFVNTGAMGRFYYRVRAHTTGGFSDYSAVAEATATR